LHSVQTLRKEKSLPPGEKPSKLHWKWGGSTPRLRCAAAGENMQFPILGFTKKRIVVEGRDSGADKDPIKKKKKVLKNEGISTVS